MQQVIYGLRPELIFHAAAHKHVPMMEENPGEAIKNNVFGTKIVADLAAQSKTARFVLISTDKAVNPTSVMGASKRLAELYLQSLSQQNNSTIFAAVRFGNVLGSNGSVIPIFKEQIAKGGPVSVTHPEMQRYFMTIPEASQLVLQAAALGQGGEVFMLDMGQPVRILDLATDLIRLSGLEPERDIKIVFSGIRPGEKLFEELSTSDEHTQQTDHEKVMVAKVASTRPEELKAGFEKLHRVLNSNEHAPIWGLIQGLVPEFSGKPPTGGTLVSLVP